MNKKLHRKIIVACVAGASGIALPAIVQAQSERSADMMLEEVIVSARRRVESLQEVPLTVNVVTPEELDNLNIRTFEDLSGVVAGLTLSADAYAPNASMRGVRFDTIASGFNPTVEFYMNDSPLVSTMAMQALFDIGRIEVLRGPQGTLRGRASPSGSITIETRRPNSTDLEGYVDVSFEERGGKNLRGGLNVPIIEDMLAVRFAGYQEKNDLNGVKSTTGGKSEYDSSGYRVSVGFQPVDSVSINAMYQRIKPNQIRYSQVESANLANPDLPATDQAIEPEDRRAVSSPQDTRRDMQRTGLEIEWALDAIAVNYAGSYNEMDIVLKDNDLDPGSFFTSDYPDELQNFGSDQVTNSQGYSHELRVTSNDPVFDLFDFVAGGLYQHNESPTNLIRYTPVFIGGVSPDSFATLVETPIVRNGETTEQSIFGNLTFHLGDNMELSLGARYIEFEDQGETIVSASTISEIENKWDATIYTASLKYHFTTDMMGYVSYGSSWRPGINAIGDFSFVQTPRERSFQNLEPETSDSIEFGLKSTWMDQRLRFNATAYYQEFDNYPYRATGDIFYVSTDVNGAESVEVFNFVAATPVKVHGVEIETDFQATEHLNVGALLSWSEGKLDNATIPCNDYLPADGRPDNSSAIPTVDDIRNATGGDNLAACTANFRSNNAPLWTSTLRAQYDFPVGGFEGYVRGLWTLYGDSKNDPTNALDDVDSYNILNLYLGLHSPGGAWEVMFYGKNITDTEEVLSRTASPASVPITVVTPPTFAVSSVSGVSDYRVISMTPPREFGINLRYVF